ncbi:hypothetical protein PFISCL1PPCAC_21648, partial [Pristionchus fissidentatus]
TLTGVSRCIIFIVMCIIADKQSLHPVQPMRHLRPFLPFVQPDQGETAEMKADVTCCGRLFMLAKTILLAITVLCLAFAPLLSTVDYRAFILANHFACFNIIGVTAIFVVKIVKIEWNGAKNLNILLIAIHTTAILLITLIVQSGQILASSADKDEGAFSSSMFLVVFVVFSLVALAQMQGCKDRRRLPQRLEILQHLRHLQHMEDVQQEKKQQQSLIWQLPHKFDDGLLFERVYRNV